jgi:chemotaxis protein methyltransferase CheR
MPSSLPESLTGDPYYSALKELLVDFTGLHYYADKDADLARRLERRLRAAGVRDCAAYLQLLRDPVRGAPERDELIAEITIDETYFFRHREHFDALRDLVLPDIMARNQPKRSLRIWSAGCANGSEPYSLVILLKREMSERLPGWNVSILGTDINRQCLGRARQGRYEDWALRSTPDNVKRECFSGGNGKGWTLESSYREWVTFQCHNLVDDAFPSLVNNLSAFDLIVCRNVMIYFGTELMRRMVRQFHDCLVPGGWLLVGPAEPNMSCFTAFQAVNAPGLTLYQKPVEGSAPLPPPVFPLTLPETPAIRLGPLSPLPLAYASSSETSVPLAVPSRDREGAVVTLDEVRAHADRGDWLKAAHCCEELLRHDALNARVHFCYGLVLEQTARHGEAERSLRRAIYLDRRFVLPHYYLALLLQSHGDPRQAMRSFDNTLELLRSCPNSGVVPDGDGITVAELRKLAETHLEILRERL